jgi:Flp pilus assembly protein TadG
MNSRLALYSAPRAPLLPLRVGSRKGNFKRQQSGQTLVEMAFLVPVLLLLLVGVIEIGRYTYIAVLVGNAARAGSEYAIQGNAWAGYAPGIIAAAKNDFQNNGQDPNTLTVTYPAGQPNFTFANFTACTCENSSGVYVTQPTTNYCTAPPKGTNNSAGSCPATQHWVVVSGVEARGTFNSILLPAGGAFMGIPGSITIDRTSILQVAP